MNDFNQNSQNTNDHSQDSPQNIPQDTIQSTEDTFHDSSDEITKTTGENKSIGAVIAVVIIVAIFVVGGFYYWGKTVNDLGVDQNLTAEEIANQPDEALNKLESQGTSDKPTAIEADLGATNLDNLDAELGNINAELGL